MRAETITYKRMESIRILAVNEAPIIIPLFNHNGCARYRFLSAKSE